MAVRACLFVHESPPSSQNRSALLFQVIARAALRIPGYKKSDEDQTELTETKEKFKGRLHPLGLASLGLQGLSA